MGREGTWGSWSPNVLGREELGWSGVIAGRSITGQGRREERQGHGQELRAWGRADGGTGDADPAGRLTHRVGTVGSLLLGLGVLGLKRL